MADEEFEDRTGVVIVALPAATDSVVAASSEDIAHMTLVWLGDASDLPATNVDIDGLKENLGAWANTIDGPITEGVAGSAMLGADKASVVLVDASAFSQIRDGMVNEFAEGPSQDGVDLEVGADEQAPIAKVHSQTEQFPVWTPHVTLGYPETPPLAEYTGTEITFDRLALWVGDDRTEFPLGEAMTAPTAPAPAPAVEPVDDDSLLDDLFSVEDPELFEDPGPIPFHGVMAPIGIPSRDGRMFAPGAVHAGPGATLRYRPEEEHGGTIAIGTITEMFEEDGLIKYQGVFASPDVRPEVNEVIQGLAEGWLSSTSVDLGAMEIGDVEDSEFATTYPDATLFTLAEISALTVVGIGAFREAYFALGECDCPDVEETLVASAVEAIREFAPGTHDGPGWITNPEDTARIRRYWVRGKGAAKIKWGVPGDFNRCRAQLGKYVQRPDWLAGLCANMHKEAIGVWPGREGGDRAAKLIASGEFTPAIVASAAPAADLLPAAWFKNPELTEPTPLTVTPEGRIYGHLAVWGTCHIGIPGTCTTPPSSPSNYSYFRVGMVTTDEGDIPVGQITMGIGHAELSDSPRQAAAHYDNVNTAAADIAVGEDGIGIWFNGAVRGKVTDEKILELKRAKISGDWRDWGRGLEMIAALAVNVPGFPVQRVALAASGAHQTSLVAAGMVGVERTERETEVLGIIDAAVEEMEYRQARRERIKSAKMELSKKTRAFRIAQAKKGL